jgi:dihydroxyacetone kinase DhaKLM complex PTS-EIIA-like component DhaM
VVGIVIVSHSSALAAGVRELAAEMAGPDVRLELAGGASLSTFISIGPPFYRLLVDGSVRLAGWSAA